MNKSVRFHEVSSSSIGDVKSNSTYDLILSLFKENKLKTKVTHQYWYGQMNKFSYYKCTLILLYDICRVIDEICLVIKNVR